MATPGEFSTTNPPITMETVFEEEESKTAEPPESKATEPQRRNSLFPESLLRRGSASREVSPSKLDDYPDGGGQEQELELFPGGLELPRFRSPRGSIHSLIGSASSSRRNSSQGSNSSTISWSSLQALRLAAARARSTSLPQQQQQQQQQPQQQQQQGHNVEEKDKSSLLEYSLMLSETNFAGGGPSQLQQNEYSYMSMSPDFTFQALTQGATALAKVAAQTAAATAKASEAAAAAVASPTHLTVAAAKPPPPGTLGKFRCRHFFHTYS